MILLALFLSYFAFGMMMPAKAAAKNNFDFMGDEPLLPDRAV